jgi:putative aldouronate transport system permease protein
VLISKKTKKELPLHLMLIPGIVLVLVYAYVPMLGIVIAFQKFVPVLGVFRSQWIGMQNFDFVMSLPDTAKIVWNTVYISSMKIVAGLIVPIIIALLLNEITRTVLRRMVQTFIYIPHFLSWVILGGIFIDLLSPSYGVVNRILTGLGFESVFFLGSNTWFPFVLVSTDVWKEFGFGTIVFLAAISGINHMLYEAAMMDGASRWRQTWHITLPGMAPIIVLMATLSIGNVLNAGFDQVFNLYSPVVYESGDILDTFIYRIGLLDAQYGIATAVGLFKSVISFALISLSYWLAYRFANYRIF